MIKKGLLLLVLVAIVTGGAFAQDFEGMPKNTVTVDIGPTIIGVGVKTVMDRVIGGAEGVSSSAFGIAAQYEFQLQEKFSVAFRFAYMGFGMGFEQKDDYNHKGTLKTDISSFSLEGHARWYPAGDTFFLDGMLGYANLTIKASGEGPVEQWNGKEMIESVSDSFSRGYLKLGPKIGWRIDFGKPGGFVFEPSFGWYLGIGLGDTFSKQLQAEYGGGGDGDEALGVSELMFGYLEDYIFIGGPRFCLSFGWRF